MSDSIEQYLSNARLFLDASAKFPPPTNPAAEILLLLVSWENMTLAEQELDAWARDEVLDSKLLKDHALKLKNAPEITRRFTHEAYGKQTSHRYSTGRDLADLRLVCQYGSNTETKEVKALFGRGWGTDEFRRGLVARIEWIETLIGAYRQLS